MCDGLRGFLMGHEYKSIISELKETGGYGDRHSYYIIACVRCGDVIEVEPGEEEKAAPKDGPV
jgi:hypothetical protein